MPFPSLVEAANHGILGITSYWTKWILDLAPLGYGIYCIYLCTLLAHHYWIKAVGSSALICCIFSLIVAFGAVFTNFIYQFQLLPLQPTIRQYIWIGSSTMALIIAAILLSFFTVSQMSRSSSDLYDYTVRNNATNAEANHYFEQLTPNSGIIGNFTGSIATLIFDRSICPKIPLISFFSIWLFSFLFSVIFSYDTEVSNYNYNTQKHPEPELPISEVSHNEEEEMPTYE